MKVALAQSNLKLPFTFFQSCAILDAMRKVLLLLAFVMLWTTGPLHADQTDSRLVGLFEELQAKLDANQAKQIEFEIWRIWSDSNNGAVSILMRTGSQAIAREDYAGALIAFQKIVELEPGFAEGWNKRATVLYLLGDYEGSLSDIRRTLALEPRHFGALSGQGLVYLQLDRPDLALEAFKAALAVNPHMEGVKYNIETLAKQLDKNRI